MSIARNVINFVTGRTLTPTKINRAWSKLADDLIDVLKQRYGYSTFTLDWTGIDSATAISEDYIFRLKVPFSFKIVGIELISYGGANITSVALSSSMTDFITTTLITASGVRNKTTANFQATSSGTTERVFTLTVNSTGAYVLGKTYVNVLIQADRQPPSYTITQPGFVASGETVDSAKQNTAFTAYETAVTNSGTQTTIGSIQVFIRRALPAAAAIPATDRDFRIPSSQRIFNSVDLIHTGALNNNIVLTVTDDTGATVLTVTQNGSGTPPNKNQGNTFTNTQANLAYTTPGSDYKVTFNRSGAGVAGISLAYAVVYLKG